MNVVNDPAKRTELWARARASYARLIAAILALTAFTPKLRRYILGWTAQLESIVRKLLFAEAAELPLVAPRAVSAGRANAKTATSKSGAAASFSFAIPQPPRPSRPRSRRSAGAARNKLKRIASRLEALRNALADPLPLAHRLARILARRASVTINARFAIAATRPHHVDRFDPHLIVEVLAVALAVEQPYADTT